MNSTQQYGKNRQWCQQNEFYYAVCQSLLYYYREFPSNILSVYNGGQRIKEETGGKVEVEKNMTIDCSSANRKSGDILVGRRGEGGEGLAIAVNGIARSCGIDPGR